MIELASVENFKNLMRKWPTGVSVISTLDKGGNKYALTANSLVSVSLEPILLSFCIKKTSPTFKALLEYKQFVISILSNHQQDIASHFAMSLPDKFENIEFELCKITSCPYITDCLGYVPCETISSIEAGDHQIIVGKVLGISMDKGKSPLIYYNREFRGI